MVDSAAVFRNFNSLEPLRKTFRDVLLKEAGHADAAVITFHRNRPSSQVRQYHRRDRFVIRGEIAFRDAVVGKEHFVRMRDHLIPRPPATNADGAACRGWSTR